MRKMSNGSFCTRTIRPGISITRQTRSAAGTPRRITTIFTPVAESVADAGAVLLTGPPNAQAEVVEHIRVHDPQLTKLVVGVETVDHPSDSQLVAQAKKYFMAAD